MHFYAYLRCRKRQNLTHLVPQGHECVVHARPGAGVEGHVGFGIKRGAAGQDALEVFHGFAAGGHGPHIPLRRHTTHMVRRVGLQPDGVAVREHQVEVGRVRDQPARRGYDHLRVDLDGLFQRAAFVAAVGVCAVEVVDFADAATGKLFDLAAEFDEGIAQVIRQTLAQGGFARAARIALIGLRGAGKSTLGRRLAEDLGYAFIELSREIEQFAGCSIHEIHNLYGTNAYRRYERRALEEAIQIYPEVVIATPGGLVADAANFNLLLQHCYTIWLQADATDHMNRVAAQGDMRPMAASPEAMDDLKRILAGRTPFYAKADLRFNTSAYSEEEAFRTLRRQVRAAIDRDM